MHRLELGTDVPDALAPYLAVDRSQPLHECWVTGHMVAGLDGTAAVGGRVGALSTAADQALFRRMRQIADSSSWGPRRYAARATHGAAHRGGPGTAPAEGTIADPAARRGQPVAGVRLDEKVFTDAPEDARTYLITCAAADPERRAEAEEVAEVIVAGEDRVEPAAATQALAELGRRVVLCEGGPTWLGELVAADRLDELCLSISPLMGGDPLPVSVTPPGAGLARFELKGAMAEDDTLFLRYERAPQAGDRRER